MQVRCTVTVGAVTLTGLILGLVTGFDLLFKSILDCCGIHFSTKTFFDRQFIILFSSF